jgi:hypothetical protein
MRPVSIDDFIRIIYSDDSNPPTVATIRRQCSQVDQHDRPLIPGAFKCGKPWKIDLDVYIPEMQRRIGNAGNAEPSGQQSEDDFLNDLADRLAS